MEMPGVKVDKKRAMVSEGGFRILILGFGSCGQELLSAMVCNGQFLKKDEKGQKVPAPFSVDIVEQDKKVIEGYCIRHPTVRTEYNVTFVDDVKTDDDDHIPGGVRTEGKSFDDWFRGQLKNTQKKFYNRIIICLNGDERSLSIATKVVEFSRRQGVRIKPGIIFARVRGATDGTK